MVMIVKKSFKNPGILQNGKAHDVDVSSKRRSLTLKLKNHGKHSLVQKSKNVGSKHQSLQKGDCATQYNNSRVADANQARGDSGVSLSTNNRDIQGALILMEMANGVPGLLKNSFQSCSGGPFVKWVPSMKVAMPVSVLKTDRFSYDNCSCISEKKSKFQQSPVEDYAKGESGCRLRFPASVRNQKKRKMGIGSSLSQKNVHGWAS